MPAITEILSDDDLALIRSLFDNALMNAAALAAVSGSYGRAAPMTELIIDQFYREDGEGDADRPANRQRILPRRDVERTVISVLAAQRCDWALAVHVYWGLCIDKDPLTPGDIAETILLASLYSGTEVQSEGTKVLEAVLTALSSMAAQAREAASHEEQVKIAGTAAVVGTISGKMFPISQPF